MSKIKVYPTLIDTYFGFLEKDYISFQNLINKINRVYEPPSEPAKKGIAFNLLIDQLIKGCAPLVEYKDELPLYRIESDGEVYVFPKEIADAIFQQVEGATTQVFCKADIPTIYGDVELYGYADYVLMDTVFELKTTSTLVWPKFSNSVQHRAYLYALRANGIKVSRAAYLVTDFSTVFVEDYYWTDKIKSELSAAISQFLGFVEKHRDLITDKKVLGL